MKINVGRISLHANLNRVQFQKCGELSSYIFSELWNKFLVSFGFKCGKLFSYILYVF